MTEIEQKSINAQLTLCNKIKTFIYNLQSEDNIKKLGGGYCGDYIESKIMRLKFLNML